MEKTQTPDPQPSVTFPDLSPPSAMGTAHMLAIPFQLLRKSFGHSAACGVRGEASSLSLGPHATWGLDAAQEAAVRLFLHSGGCHSDGLDRTVVERK